MKTKLTRAAYSFLCFAILIGLFGSCSIQDHDPNTCSEVEALLASCTAGYAVFVTINTSTNDPIGGSGEKLVVMPGDITQGQTGCLYKGNSIQGFGDVNNRSLLVTKPGFQIEYRCGI
ncbi:hypothetical protein [Larkinella rosea]|uniref:Lipoprotein n=1 Tax=Larkinella rosea TaxID=2025312 RepID=A0A3P1BYW2_9BACT|nr:hypothetical protein [Larkinella rosea]RRB06275.1 hypothetical protein EHT25_00265 [Larkinella rosea]